MGPILVRYIFEIVNLFLFAPRLTLSLGEVLAEFAVTLNSLAA
jgi:hypothetical protein